MTTKNLLIELFTIYLYGMTSVTICFVPTNYNITKILMGICMGIISGLRITLAYIRIKKGKENGDIQ